MPASAPHASLDPEALARLKNLSLAARVVVEGSFSGMHKSPHRGFSVEFAEHREYTPGIDPRHIDWRVFGRRDKLYVKQYEEETSLHCCLVLDTSASMGYRSGAAVSKHEYGVLVAASLAYLVTHQHDAVGLTTFDTTVRTNLPARQGPGHLRNVLESLEQTRTGGESGLAATFHRLAETLKRRSLVVVISDLFDDPGAVLGALKHLRHKKHDVIVLHTLDPHELTFPFDDVTKIEDLETRREVMSDPRAFRNAYLEELTKFLEAIRAGCRSARIDYALAQTDQRFDAFIATYLARRQQ